MARSNRLAAQVHAALTAVADPDRAPAMQAYMKSDMPFLGVPMPMVRTTCRRVFSDLSYETAISWQDDVLVLWRSARHREERYAAIELSGIRQARDFQRLASLKMYEEMIVTGAWWDFVDAIAGQRLGLLLDRDRAAMTKAMLRWARSDNLWLRRSAILCQLNAKAATDLDLLYGSIAPSLDSKAFFLRKAIGWALRQYARTDPSEVRRYVAAQSEKLQPLSKREALKRLA